LSHAQTTDMVLKYGEMARRFSGAGVRREVRSGAGATRGKGRRKSGLWWYGVKQRGSSRTRGGEAA